jgi:YD repeat-containing protein
MKTIKLLLAGLALSSFVSVGDNNSLSDSNIKGRVKRIKGYEYNAAGTVLFGSRVNVYDEMGNEVADSSFNVDGTLFIGNATTYTYDGDGNKLTQVILNQDGTVSWETLYTYAKNGLLRESNRFHSDGRLEERYMYKYEGNRKVEEKSIDAEGKVRWVTKYEYDKHGNPTGRVDEDKCFLMPEEFTHYSKVKYNDNGNITEQEDMDGKNQPLHSIRNIGYRYDVVGNVVEMMQIVYKHRQNKTDTVLSKRDISYY